MSLDGYHTILVLGGIRSGKSEFAESLVNEAVEVRYVATSAATSEDPEWAARLQVHRDRRPAAWTTEETGSSPARLAGVLAEAKPDQTLLIDDLGGWLTALLDEGGWSAGAARGPVDALAAAVRDCAARVVIVSPEVGLSVVPATDSGRAFADAMGDANRSLARVCDAVVLVVAGQPGWLKPSPATMAVPAVAGPAAAPPTAAVAPTRAEAPAPTEAPTPAEAPPQAEAPAEPLTAPLAPAETVTVLPTQDLPLPAPGAPAGTEAGAGTAADADGLITRLTAALTMPDETAVSAVEQRMAGLDTAGPGLGRLGRAVTFAAGVQGTGSPRPFGSVRVLLLHGDHTGGVAAGDDPAVLAARVQRFRDGAGPLGMLATQAGARLQVVEVGGADRPPVALPIESGAALEPDRVEAALRRGVELADAAVDEGVDLLILAAAGAGQQAAAAAVVAAGSTTEPAVLLPRVYQPGGRIDDDAWMIRCGAIRDGLRRLINQSRDARAVLSALAGEDIAVAAGVLVGAAARRVPVLIDGPVGMAAAVVARDLSAVTRHWTLLAEHGEQPTVKAGADMLGVEPLLDLRLGLGEGAGALAALPLIQSALSIVDSA